MPLTKIVHILGLLFDMKYIGANGQLQGGEHKLTFLTSQSSVMHMRLASKVLKTILGDTAEVLGIRYPSKTQDEILQVQRMWEQLDSNLSKEIRIFKLRRRIIDLDSDLKGYFSWKIWRTIQDDVEWMEMIFRNGLEDPSADWDMGNANIKRILPCPSAPYS